MKQDYAKALIWYHKAAKQGHADTQVNLGFMLREGQGVKQDYAKALSWYLKAADQGHANAQFSLGFMFREGRGVKQDGGKHHHLKAVLTV